MRHFACVQLCQIPWDYILLYVLWCVLTSQMCDAMWYDIIWYDITWCGNIGYKMKWYFIILYDVAITYVIWCDVIWCDMIWCDVIKFGLAWLELSWFDLIWSDLMWYDIIVRNMIRCGKICTRWFVMICCPVAWYYMKWSYAFEFETIG